MLKQYRDEIDKIDEQLFALLNQRFKITKQVGEYKRANNIQILNANREGEIINKISSLDLEHSQHVIEVYKQILKSSRQQQDE
ncbi:chorismate mutase [Mollicutes bacterium LVI A0039]|nr:chorismate mutase [Mollicutes bacterium LVI A0039]